MKILLYLSALFFLVFHSVNILYADNIPDKRHDQLSLASEEVSSSLIAESAYDHTADSQFRYRPFISYSKKVVLGGGLGGLSAYLILSQFTKIDNDAMTVGFLYIGVVPLVTSLGVYLAGYSESEFGRYVPAMVGGFIGIGSSVLGKLFVGLATGYEPDNIVTIAVTVAATLTGSIIGYNLSARPWPDSALVADNSSVIFGLPSITVAKNKETKEQTIFCRLFRLNY